MARVLVTRAAHQASALADALVGLGLEVIAIPAIELAAPSDGYESIDEAVADLDEYDWLLFTSANAVSVFASRCEEAEVVPPLCRVASIGAATTRALRKAGLAVELQPATAIAEELAFALEPHARGSRMLLVRAEQGRDVLPARLRDAGATVTLASAYRTVVPQMSVELLRQVSGNFDAITFTSSSSVDNLIALFAEARLTFPQKAVFASIGPVTSAALREHGYQPNVEASTAQVEVLAAELAHYLRRRG